MVYAKVSKIASFFHYPSTLFSSCCEYVGMLPCHMAKHNLIGEKGERLAVDYFHRKGYQILHKNWRKGRNEIDIIARSSATLHFIEVKTLSYAGRIPPEHAVHRKKLQGLMKAAAAFLVEGNQNQDSIQFDVLSITLYPKTEMLLIEDVYLYPK